MERDTNRDHPESLVRRLTEERERFVSAWQQGARPAELTQIRQNIKQLNDLLWERTLQHNGVAEAYQSGDASQRDIQGRAGPANQKP
ncbi:MAG: hypothetical protein H7122_17485 [Chitinophagaceae bacterium]|nr:hypothetical protein [Chitinophagaceae bacterium]